MKRPYSGVRLAFGLGVLVLAAISVVVSGQDALLGGRHTVTSGPIAIVAGFLFAVLSLYLVYCLRSHLDTVRPPYNFVLCAACGNRAGSFDRRCLRCGGQLMPRLAVSGGRH
jgi:hypothetical protein